MTEKRYKVHNMIKGMNVGESVDLELMKELIEKYGKYENVEVEIMDNGKSMTYKEVVDLLNENEQLKKENKELEQITSQFKLGDIINLKTANEIINEQRETIKEFIKENTELKEDIDTLKRQDNARKQYQRELKKENEQLKKENEYIKALYLGTMFNTVKSFKGDWSKRFEYHKDSDMVFDTANHYGSNFRILDKEEMVILLNGYSTIVDGDVE